MKKEYKKPQVVEVKLTIKNPILGACDVGGASEEFGLCGVSPFCEFP
jgi:hypothetical protein